MICVVQTNGLANDISFAACSMRSVETRTWPGVGLLQHSKIILSYTTCWSSNVKGCGSRLNRANFYGPSVVDDEALIVSTPNRMAMHGPLQHEPPSCREPCPLKFTQDFTHLQRSTVHDEVPAPFGVV